MASTTNTIIKAVRLAGTGDFAQRVPDPSVQGITATMKALFSPTDRRLMNEFMDILINKVAFTIVHKKRWDNPLAVFTGRQMSYGAHIEEVALRWLKAHSYKDDWGDRAEDVMNLLKIQRPDGRVAYHTINRNDQYLITVNEEELEEAFTSESGLAELLSAIMDVPYNSDQYDTYKIMMELMAMYEKVWGFYKYHLDAIPEDEASGKTFLTAVRELTGLLQFPRTTFNAQTITDIPVFAKPSELVLFVTPRIDAVLDVNVLAYTFNLELADIKLRKIVVDEFPIPDAVALLTTEDFFVVHDKLYTNTSFYNPNTLSTNYYLTHRSLNSVSPFVPAILFTLGEGTPELNTVTLTTSGMTLKAAEETIVPGGEVQLTVALQGALDPDDPAFNVAPNAATFEITATDGENAVELDALTFIDEHSVLHTSPYLEVGTVITVNATSAYVNPTGETTEYTASAEITVAEPTRS